jgi:hypothetical protein
MFEFEGRPFLAWRRMADLWFPGGYKRVGLAYDLRRLRLRPLRRTLRVLEAGYRPWVRESVLTRRCRTPAGR